MDIMSWNTTSDKYKANKRKNTKTMAYMAHSHVFFKVLCDQQRRRERELGLYCEGFKKSEWCGHTCAIISWSNSDGQERYCRVREMKWRPETRKWCGKEVVHSRVFALSNLSCFFLVRAPADNWGCVACRDDTALSNRVIQRVLSLWEEHQPGQADKQIPSCWIFGLTDNIQLKWWLKMTLSAGKKHGSKGYTHSNVHCRTVYNSQDLEAT